MLKACLACHAEKDLGDFHIARDKPDGRRNTCKKCRSKNKRAMKPLQVICFGCKKVIPFIKKYFHINEQTNIVKLRRKCIVCYKRDELNRHYLRMYSISLQQVEEIAAGQNNRCAICAKESKLFVDHNHATGQMRQLLCDVCNRGIGYLQEDITILQNAINYLQHHERHD